MIVDRCRFAVGEEWAYRLRDRSAPQRVRILAVTPKKNSVRVDIEFLDDTNGRVENVPGSRLRVPWGEVAAFDQLMANWRRIDDYVLDDTEQACVEQVFVLLIEDGVAELLWSPVSGATVIRDGARLSEIIRMPVEEILAAGAWFDHDGGTS